MQRVAWQLHETLYSQILQLSCSFYASETINVFPRTSKKNIEEQELGKKNEKQYEENEAYFRASHCKNTGAEQSVKVLKKDYCIWDLQFNPQIFMNKILS